MKVTIDKELLDQVLAICKVLERAEPVEEPVKSNWLDNVPEKHRKFAAYWDEIGRPELETKRHKSLNWYFLMRAPDWTARYYRIKDDPHWELRLKWINSDKTLPIEWFNIDTKNWYLVKTPLFVDSQQYREAKLWYEQEISKEKPIFLRNKLINPSLFYAFSEVPPDKDNWTPLTDQEIDALKRGF